MQRGIIISSTSEISRRPVSGFFSDAVADPAPCRSRMMQGRAGLKDAGERTVAAWSKGVSECSARFPDVGPEPGEVARSFRGNL
jgi:hypothetical protein